MVVVDRLRSTFVPAGPARGTTDNPRFPALDGYRALAAFGVVVFHVAGITDSNLGDGLVPNILMVPCITASRPCRP